jgi:ABC-2 type transport system permease protein
LPGVHVALLGNPTGSLEWYLGLLLGPGILHLAIAVTAIGALTPCCRMALSPRLSALRRARPGRSGRLLPHVGAGTALATAWLLWLVLARGYRVEGSVLALVGGYALLFAATVSIALFLLAWCGSRPRRCRAR